MKNNYKPYRFLYLYLALLFCISIQHISAQNSITINGQVRDTQGTLPGVMIQIINSSNGVLTDENGNYSIQVKPNEKLLFSFIGYHSQEIQIVNQRILNVELVQDTEQLDEITINAGYYTVKDKERTGSIARVTAKDIELQPVLNPLQALQGRMAGVHITQYSGVAGGGFDIKIRGENSLRKTGFINANSPLFIIDGVPFLSDRMTNTNLSASILPMGDSNPLNAINPKDIESIEILKDADATAIYGSRGANGVVLITTKRNKSGKTNFSINTSTAFSKVASKMKLLNTQQFNQMREEAYARDGNSMNLPSYHDLNGNWDRNRNTDWQKELIGGTAMSKNIQLGINGGGATTQFGVSAAHNEETTVFPSDKGYKRNSFNLHLNHQSKDNKLQVNASSYYSIQQNNLLTKDLTSLALTLAPNAPALYKADGSLNWQNGTFENPLAYEQASYSYENTAAIYNVNLSYAFAPQLSFKLNAGLTTNHFDEMKLEPHTMYNPSLGYSSANSVAQQGNGTNSSYIIEPQFHGNFQKGKHRFDALFGATFQANGNNSSFIRGENFNSDAMITNIGSAKTKTIMSVGNSEYRYAALFGRLNYTYDGKYIINITGRRDGSSRFGDNYRFGNFGAIGGAWLFSEEEFAKELSWLNFGKLRGSYGSTGSDNIGDYQFMDTYNLGGFLYDGETGMGPTRLYNPNFSWEKTNKLEVALEIGLFKNRLNTSLAWYKNRSSNQLVGIPLPGTTGFSKVDANLNATVENKGWEWTLQTTNIQSQDWRWTSSFNISFPKNTLLAFPNLEGSTYANQYLVGQSTSIRKMYKYEGLDPATGLYTFRDYNKDNKLTSVEDKKVIKEMGVKYHGGFQNSLSYKNFNLDVSFQFVKQLQPNYDASLFLPGVMSNVPIEVLDRYSSSNTTARYAYYTSGSDVALYTATQRIPESDRAVGDASFIRLKNLSLDYTIQLPKAKIESLKIYVQGQNLWTYTNYFGLDPEFLISGYLPPLKTYALGVQLTF